MVLVLQCLTWIQHIWDRLLGPFTFNNTGSTRPLPDEVTVEILSRLPADCVLKCRRVCKKWLALTLSPSFTELHLNRATPSLFAHWLDSTPSKNHGELNFFVYDKIDQNANRKKRIAKKVLSGSGREMYHYNAVVSGSCDGLLMFLSTNMSPTIFVFNPITQELITLPSAVSVNSPCGIYLHPLTHEYKLLVRAYENHYYTYSLKTKIWKKLDYSSSNRTRGKPPAVLVNRSLHWMVINNDNTNANGDVFNRRPCTDGIMVFGTEAEDFQVLPHPGDACCYRSSEHDNMHLFGTGDRLCLYHVSLGEVISIWVLEDYDNWGWDRRYKVKLDWFNDNLRFEPKFLKVLGIQDGELLIDWKSRGVFSYNLDKNTFCKVSIKVEGCEIPSPYASVYTKSLVRLSDISAR